MSKVQDIIKQIKEDTGEDITVGSDSSLKLEKISSSIPDLDKILGGGFVRGRTHILKGGYSSGKCVSGDTYVFTEQGIHTINTYGANLSSEQIGARTTIFDGFGVKRKAELYFDGIRNTREIITKHNFSLTGTYEHPILIINSSGILEFKKLKDIIVGDYVAIDVSDKPVAFEYVNIPQFDYFSDISEDKVKYVHCQKKWPKKLPNIVDENLARLLGYLIGDGCGKNLTFTNMYDDLLNDFANISAHLFGLTTRLDVPKNSKNGKAATICLRSPKYLRKWLKLVGYDGDWRAATKEVPISIMQSPPSVIANFLKGYFDCDGDVSNRTNLCVYSKSIKLIKQVQILLLSLGILSSYKFRKGGAELRIGREDLPKYLSVIGLTCAERKNKLMLGVNIPCRKHYKTLIPNQQRAIKMLINKIYSLKGAHVGNSWVVTSGPRRKLDVYPNNWDRNVSKGTAYVRKEELYRLLLHLKEYAYLDEYKYLYEFYLKIKTLVFVDVISVRDAGKLPVYDYAVEEYHHFNSGGFVSHNTFLAHNVIKSAQQSGGTAALVDMERSFDPEWAKLCGVDIDKLIVSTPPFGEKALDITVSLIKANVDVVVLDSIAALIPTAEEQEGMEQLFMAPLARMMNKGLRKITVANKHTVFIGINQEREGLGGQVKMNVLPAGKGQEFFASIILDVGRGDWLKDGDTRTGFYIKCFTVKNKVAMPQQQTVLPFVFGKGIDAVLGVFSAAVDAGKIQKVKNTFIFDGVKLGTMKSALEALRTDAELLDKIKLSIP